MRDAARTFVASAPACGIIAVGWLSIAEPTPAWSAVAVVALALGAALLPSWLLRAAGTAIAAVIAVRVAFGVWLPVHPLGALDRIHAHLDSGFLDFYATHLPFDPRAHVEMGALVVAGIFIFALLTALLAAARRPALAALALLAGAGWPETLLRPERGALVGASILLAGLALLAALESRRIPSLAPPVAAAVVLAAIAVGSATASNRGVLQWQRWNLASAGSPTSAASVWDAQYSGLTWPRRKTVVLGVESRTRPSYLRAAVLDDFLNDRWVAGPLRAADSLEPAAAFRSSRQTKAVVTIAALVDTRLVGGSVPIRFEADAPIVEPAPGFAFVPEGLDPGFKYTVWSYSPKPSSTELSRVRPVYPEQLLDGGMLDVGADIRPEPFGTPGRAAKVRRALAANTSLRRYMPLARIAEHVTREATSPYAAALDLQQWFLGGGGFRYSNHPRAVAPALVGFVTRTRSGYCQHYAGAMALMLRYVGVPARVAVGFAGPGYDRARHTWVMTDHDAHAWVEVWFRGYGWLPFDPTPPTPGQHRSPFAAGAGRQGGGGGSSPPLKVAPHTANAQSAQFVGRGATPGTRIDAPTASTAPHGRGWFVYVLVLVLTAAAGVGWIVATKALVRLRGRLERDPRRVAAACQKELADFLFDQWIDSPRTATLQEVGQLVHRRLGVDARAFVAAGTAARFGRIENAPAAARDSRRELKELLDSCRHVLTRRERLRGLLSSRSLVRAHAAAEWPTPVGSGSA